MRDPKDANLQATLIITFNVESEEFVAITAREGNYILLSKCRHERKKISYKDELYIIVHSLLYHCEMGVSIRHPPLLYLL